MDFSQSWGVHWQTGVTHVFPIPSVFHLFVLDLQPSSFNFSPITPLFLTFPDQSWNDDSASVIYWENCCEAQRINSSLRSLLFSVAPLGMHDSVFDYNAEPVWAEGQRGVSVGGRWAEMMSSCFPHRPHLAVVSSHASHLSAGSSSQRRLWSCRRKRQTSSEESIQNTSIFRRPDSSLFHSELNDIFFCSLTSIHSGGVRDVWPVSHCEGTHWCFIWPGIMMSHLITDI